MIKKTKYRISRLFALAVLVLLGLNTCSTRHDSAGLSPADPRVNSPLEIECERELVHLDALIEARRMDGRLRAEVLAEVIELRRAAGELFMRGEFELALELVEEAVSMLEETG
jgi:hypothetical protein